MDEDLFDREDEIRAWMHDLAALPVDEGALGDGRRIWLKAELLRRWDEQRQTVKPIERAERIHVGIGLAGALLLLMSLWEYVPAPNATMLFATALTLMLIGGVAALMLKQS
jgi:hypothetical protein